VLTYILAVKNNYPKGEAIKREDVPRILREGILGLFTIVIIMGGILSGYFTATESAAIGALYAFIITFFFYIDFSLCRMKLILYFHFIPLFLNTLFTEISL